VGLRDVNWGRGHIKQISITAIRNSSTVLKFIANKKRIKGNWVMGLLGPA